MARNLDDEIAAFEKMQKNLLENHNGKFVIVHQGELVGVYDTFDSAAKVAIASLQQPYLIRQVGANKTMPMPASVAYRQVHATV